MEVRQTADVPKHGPAEGHLAPHADSVLAVIILFLILTTTFTCLRFYSRWLMSRRIFVTEWFLLSGLFLFYGFCVACLIALYQGGIGAHITQLGTSEITLSLKVTLVVQILYAACLGIVKISVCVLYLDIFPQYWIRVCSWILIGINSAWALMTILIGLLICRPLSANWDPSAGRCGNQHAAYSAVSAIEICIDLCMMCPPLPVIWHLKMPTGSKIATSSLFCLGLVTTVCTGVRLDAILDINYADFSYTSVDIFIWTTVELGVAIIVTSAMGLRRLFVRIFPTQQWTRERSGPANADNTYGTPGRGSNHAETFGTKGKNRRTELSDTFTGLGKDDDMLALADRSETGLSDWSPPKESPVHDISVTTEISVHSTSRG